MKLRVLACLMSVGAATLFVSAAPAGEKDLTDPVDILKKVDAAAKAVKVARYDVIYEGLGEAAARVPKITGSFLTMGFEGMRPKKFKAEVRIKMPNSEETRHVTVGADGENYYVLDHGSKKAYVDMDPAVLGSAGSVVGRAAVLEYGHPKPFSDEINGKTKEIKGTCEVGGEEGYEIHVVYANDTQEAVWCFSKKTMLPRRRVDSFKRPTGEVFSQRRTVTKLVVNEEVSDEDFRPKIPEGYEKVDDFAP